MALVLVPEAPIVDWLAEIDVQIQRSPSFFAGRPVVVDLSAVRLHQPGFNALLQALKDRNIRVIGVEGADPSLQGLDGLQLPLPSVAGAGRPSSPIEIPEETAAAHPAQRPQPPSLLLDRPIRSGESVVFPKGDVTVVGSVASGAEIVAGGSVHVYGALRGRAIAGLIGDAGARIFCRRLEAELLAIDGLYKTADDMDASLRGRAVQAWLSGEAMVLAALD